MWKSARLRAPGPPRFHERSKKRSLGKEATEGRRTSSFAEDGTRRLNGGKKHQVVV